MISNINKESIIVELIGDERIVIPRGVQIEFKPTLQDKVVVGLRREFSSLIDFDKELVQKDNIISGTVLSDRFLGDKRRTVVNIDYGRVIEIKRNPLEKSYTRGDLVMVSIPIGNAFLFSNPPNGLEDALSVT